jgi:mRNA-degrading endonuclease RelE of RelBE toxin-antitoxin system
MSENIQAALLRNQFGDLISNIPGGKITQRPSYKGSKAPKYTTDDIKNLAQLIIQKQRGIGFDRKLMTKDGAEKFIRQRKLENRLRAVSGDFDDDPITPDNVVIVDNRNIPKYIDGYSIIPSTKRISGLTTAQTDKAVLKAYSDSSVDTRLYKRWMIKYLTEAERRAHTYDEWKASMVTKNPNFGQPSDYSLFYKSISDDLKKLLKDNGLQVSDFNYIGLLARIVKDILDDYKRRIELQPGQKLNFDDYVILSQIERIRN